MLGLEITKQLNMVSFLPGGNCCCYHNIIPIQPMQSVDCEHFADVVDLICWKVYGHLFAVNGGQICICW